MGWQHRCGAGHAQRHPYGRLRGAKLRAARRPWSAWAEAVADDTPIAREAHTMCGKLWNRAGSA
jgi:hypothetical protein